MAKYARLNAAGLVMETCDSDPSKLFFKTLADQFNEVPDDAVAGDTITDGKAVKPVVEKLPEPTPPKQPRIAPKADVLDALTRSQRVAVKKLRATDDEVDDFMAQLDNKQALDLDNAEDIALLDRLVTDKVLTSEVVAAIKALR